MQVCTWGLPKLFFSQFSHSKVGVRALHMGRLYTTKYRMYLSPHIYSATSTSFTKCVPVNQPANLKIRINPATWQREVYNAFFLVCPRHAPFVRYHIGTLLTIVYLWTQHTNCSKCKIATVIPQKRFYCTVIITQAEIQADITVCKQNAVQKWLDKFFKPPRQ